MMKAGGGLDYPALNRVAQYCVEELRDENEDTRLGCIVEVCNRLNQSAASMDLTPPLVCTQEFVNEVAGDMNRTVVGRLVNRFMQICMNEEPDDVKNSAAVSGCVRKYVRYCFERDSNQLEECIDHVNFLCDTIDDPNGQRQCLEAAEQAVSEELTEHCSLNTNHEICVSGVCVSVTMHA